MSRNCYNCMQPVEDYSGVCPHCGQAPFEVNPVHQLKTGTFLKDRYLIGKSLGQGGFGITYIGLDTMLDVRVAVKEYYPNGISNRNHEASDHVTMTSTGADVYERGKLRFLQEAKTLARFYEEPGIVSVHDFFEDNNTAYIVMEYLDGITLKRFVEARGKIPANTLFRAMRPIMRSLEKVHAQDVIHRDISPDNIMLLRDGTLKLLDFGSAREVGGDKSLSVMLKPGYAPEEQYRSKGKQGPWTDIYALCATMYYCLTEVKPEESVERMVEDTLKRPSELGADITQAQESVILRGMAVHAKDRYQSMAELLAAMNKPLPPVADSHLSPTPESPASLPDLPGGREIPKPNRSTKRTKTTHAIIIFCGFLAAVGLIAGGMKVFGSHESNPVISGPVPTLIATETPRPTIAVIANAEKESEPTPELIHAEKSLLSERKEIGSGTFRSSTGVPLNIKAQWTAETLEENKVAVTVNVFLESYSILTLAEKNALHVRVGDSYITADVPALNIDDNTDIHSSLLAITEHVCVLPEGGASFEVEIDYNFHGSYFNEKIETISCGGTINLTPGVVYSQTSLDGVNENSKENQPTEDPNIPHLYIENATYPESMIQYGTANLWGEIYTDKGVIAQVCGRIYNNDTGQNEQICMYYPYEQYFSLAATINANLILGKLEPGHYTYIVSAIAENNSYTNGEEVLIEHPFEIYYP